MPIGAPPPTLYGNVAAPWRFELATLAGARLGEITQVRDKKLTFRLNQAQTFEFTMDLAHPRMPDLVAQQHGLVKAYKRGVLMGVYEISTGQVGGSSDEHAVKVVATSTGEVRLAHRFIGQSSTGIAYTTTDRGAIVASILSTLNSVDDTKLRMGSVVPTSTATVGPWYFKGALEAIQELGATLYGYDYWFSPADPVVDPNGATGYLNIAPLRGGVREQGVFEFGSGRHNAKSYGWQFDNSGRISRAIALPSGYPNNLDLTVQTFEDAATTAAIGRREAIVQNDLVDPALRLALATEHVNVRKSPRQIFTFTPQVDDSIGRTPSFGIDYDIGDIVHGRVKDSGLLVLDGFVRVYGAVLEIDDGGAEQPTLILVDE